MRTSQAEGAVRLAAAGLGIALVPDNIVLPAIDCGVLRLAPRLIRDIAVYARTDWSPTAAAFVDVLREDARPRPRNARRRFTSKLLARAPRSLRSRSWRSLALRAAAARRPTDSSPSLPARARRRPRPDTARFKLTITAVVGGTTITAEENGTVSFTGAARTSTSRSPARRFRRSSS